MLLAIVGAQALLSTAVAAAEPEPPGAAAVDPNNYECFDEGDYLCLFDRDGGPWSASLMIQQGEPGYVVDTGLDGRLNWISSYTNGTGQTVRFYDQPEGTECWDLIFEAAPWTRGSCRVRRTT
ncbi:DUF3611 family protein [Pseudonocardia sp. TRM90224]|uniref:DUF3611 family protein n=1 Tax=Pseudonocardia sp. TRM90224 TaxID=2812678 RepID=UPI001E4BE597|nr:DUF3611 family protein [Pseudonocardia sp. TRM90224]